MRASFLGEPLSARNGSGVIKECCFGEVVALSKRNGWIFRLGGFLDLLGGWDKDSRGQKRKFFWFPNSKKLFSGFKEAKSGSGIARRPPLSECENREKWDG